MTNTDEPIPSVLRWIRLVNGLKYPIIIVGLLAMLLVTTYGTIRVRSYTATARLLPPFGEQESLTVLQGASGGLPTASWWEPEDTNEANFITIGTLKSNRVVDQVAGDMQLIGKYDIDTIENARRWLRARTDILQERHKLIELNFTCDDPEFASEVANSYLEALKYTQRTIRSSYQSFRQDQVQIRLQETQKKLTETEAEFQAFKERHNLVHMDRQSLASVDLFAKLKELEAEEQIAMSGASTYLTNRHSTIEKSQARLAKLEELQSTLDGSISFEEQQANLIRLQILPKLQRQYGELQHKIELLKETTRLLSKQNEVFRVFDAGSFPEAIVLDRATPPDQPSDSSFSKLVVLTVAFLVFALVFIIALGDIVLHFLPDYFQEIATIRLVKSLYAKIYYRKSRIFKTPPLPQS